MSTTRTVERTAFALCLCFEDVPDGSMAGQAKEFKRLSKETTSVELDQLVVRVAVDGVAHGVAEELETDGTHCSMHKFRLVAKGGIGKSRKTRSLLGMGPSSIEEGNASSA